MSWVTALEVLRNFGRGRQQIAADTWKRICTIGLNDLARLTGLSRFHFLKVFKHTTQETPYQYLLRRRVSRGSTHTS